MKKIFASLILITSLGSCKDDSKGEMELESQSKEDTIQPLIQSSNGGIIIMPEKRKDD